MKLSEKKICSARNTSRTRDTYLMGISGYHFRTEEFSLPNFCERAPLRHHEACLGNESQALAAKLRPTKVNCREPF